MEDVFASVSMYCGSLTLHLATCNVYHCINSVTYTDHIYALFKTNFLEEEALKATMVYKNKIALVLFTAT